METPRPGGLGSGAPGGRRDGPLWPDGRASEARPNGLYNIILSIKIFMGKSDKNITFVKKSRKKGV